MKPILDFFKYLLEGSERREQERREAYLAEATDLYDLEHRMRQLDRRSLTKPAWMGATGS